MPAKTILLSVADPQVVRDITQALGEGWEATAVSNEADASVSLGSGAFDALLVDFNSGEPNAASQLLNRAMEECPGTARFLIAHEADLALVAAYVSGPHEILPKPIEAASFKTRIEHSVAPDHSNCKKSVGDPDTSSGASLVVPAVYSEVLKVLDLPEVTKSQVGKIIAGDAGLTDEVLRLTKSAYLGLPRDITDPEEAVELLGLETVKALVMALRFLAEQRELKPGYLSFEAIWQHSINVAQLARDLMLFETKDRALATEALIAGLLHDLGKVVLALNFDDLYGRVHSLARNQPVALWDIEKEMFGASHGEIGACLVGMWNMPNSVVQAVALHHEPPVGEDRHLTPLAAVHIANVLEHQIRPSDEFRVLPVISMPFLNEIGLLQRLPVWRAVFTNRREANSRLKAGPGKANQPRLITPALSSPQPSLTANELPTPDAATRTATLGRIENEDEMPVASRSRQRRWVYTGVAAVVIGLFAFWFGTQPPVTVRALTGPRQEYSPALVSPALVTEPALTAESEAALAMPVLEDKPAPNAVPDPNPAPAPPASESTVATAPEVTATNAPVPTPAVEKKAPPEFRLDGIIYSVARPVAIVNGQTVFVGDRVSSATVETIGRNYVTLRNEAGFTSLFLKETCQAGSPGPS